MNPFKYGQVVSAQDFCPRPKQVKALTAYIRSGQNVVLQGERRIGKTSLICETVRKAKTYGMLYIDLLEIKSIADLGKRIVGAIFAMEQKSGLLDKAMQTLAQLRPVVSIDPITGQPSVALDMGAMNRPDSIDGLMELVVCMNQRKKLVVVIDEFQDILNLQDCYEVLAVMRSKIQFQTNIPYIFAGSVRNQMDMIFSDPDSAFFKSAVTLEIGYLPEKEFDVFIIDKFATGKRHIDRPSLARVLNVAQNIPGDTQELCACLWEVTEPGEQITEKHLSPALELIYSREARGYESALVNVTSQQMKCLVTLAAIGGGSPLSTQFLKQSGITQPTSVKKALTRLIQLMIIYRYNGEYKFVNPFFQSWLLWKNY